MILRNEKIPEPGDKFASCQAQKGTMCTYMRDEDMPFNSEGISPDIIINAHCLTGDTQITMENGITTSIKDLYDMKHDTNHEIQTANPSTKRISVTPIYNLFKKKNQPVVYINTETDNDIRCTLDHPFMTQRGWVEAEDLKVDVDYVYIRRAPRRLLDFDRHVKMSFQTDDKDIQVYLSENNLDGYVKETIIIPLVPKIISKKSVLDDKYEKFIVEELRKDLEWLNETSSTFKQYYFSRWIQFQTKNSRVYDIVDDNKLELGDIVFKDNSNNVAHILNSLRSIKIEFKTYIQYISKKTDNVIMSIKITDIAKYLSVIDMGEQTNPAIVEWYNKNFYTYSKKMYKMEGDFARVKVSEKKFLEHPEDVYDFTTVSKNHSMISNGFLTHNCIPSRMTVNQLLESVMGKACCLKGTYGDATPFSESNSKNVSNKICELLSKVGMEHSKKHGVYYSGDGFEKMTCGMTGEPIQAKVFMGPTYYQRLKHMVSDKIHARSRGVVTTLTRQPTEGRSRGGGLKVGEMETQALVSHGSSYMLNERTFKVSDCYQINLCKKCGFIISTPNTCQLCKGGDITNANIPYVSNLLIQELGAMGLKVKINT